MEGSYLKKTDKLYNKFCIWKMEKNSYCFYNKIRKGKRNRKFFVSGRY